MKINKRVVFPVVFIFIYMVYFFYLQKFLYTNNLLISLNNINASNIAVKLLSDFLGSTLIIITILLGLLIKKQSLSTIGITKRNMLISFILLVIYVGMFFIKKDFSLVGIYKCFFYLIIVSFSEELVFRGYLFNKLDKEMHTYLAVIISGIMWGAMHAIFPIIINNYSVAQSLNAIVSELGGGIVAGTFYVFLYKKSGSLVIPILIHAIFDFSSIFI